ncbi:hypothetical protein NC99_11610 [Sunxiuqinia dokdonensis]|uniref:Uncharacterized protein n=1 Tax=Sunxiuqinia dokdonensis TaxID=1409788 RepID=A0A0L8VC48_9BACT|nr:hypothetical protein NC99_11610 [Sunxiuqinia dokdonensis]
MFIIFQPRLNKVAFTVFSLLILEARQKMKGKLKHRKSDENSL